MATASASTVTTSETAPISRVTLAVAGVLTNSSMSEMTAVLKPSISLTRS